MPKRRQHTVTLADVAKRAGVSSKTVSRVVNAEKGVTAQTRRLVTRAIRELGYAPDETARHLARGESRTIALLYDSIKWDWVGLVRSGVARACTAAGYQLLLRPMDGASLPLPLSDHLLVMRFSADACVLVPTVGDIESLTNELEKRQLIFSTIQPHDLSRAALGVSPDDFVGSKSATNHLLDLGHRDLVHITVSPSHRITKERVRGFCTAMQERGLSTSDRVIFGRSLTAAEGERLSNELLRRSTGRPTGFVCANDALAGGVLRTAYRLSLRVPDALSVTGFDDSELAASTLAPALTSVRQPIEEIGYAAAQLVINAMKGGTRHAHLVLPTQLVVRESTGPPPRAQGVTP